MAKIEQYAARGVWDPPTYSQAVKVSGAETILYIAGQVAYADNGSAAHVGDFEAQARAPCRRSRLRSRPAAARWQISSRSTRI
jgi:enamine deaminase RidA (YjgF/YER057c/UK114 family)